MYDDSILSEPFNIQRHWEEYRGTYLEAIVLPDGHIEYAMPSHTEKLVQILQEQKGLSREEVIKLCPEEYYFSYIDWLLLESSCVSVWTDFCMGEPNKAQWQSQEIGRAGIYNGSITKKPPRLWRPQTEILAP